MNIEIIKVEQKECEEVHVLHIYPHSEQMHLYRRYGPDHWEHLFRGQWLRYMTPELLEDAYQIWVRNAKQAKQTAKTNK